MSYLPRFFGEIKPPIRLPIRSGLFEGDKERLATCLDLTKTSYPGDGRKPGFKIINEAVRKAIKEITANTM